jgi:hypothetical protein
MKYTEAQIAHLILTYHEGTLSPAENSELEALLLENPDLAMDLEAQPSLLPPPIQMDTTSFLHPLLEDLAIYFACNLLDEKDDNLLITFTASVYHIKTDEENDSLVKKYYNDLQSIIKENDLKSLNELEPENNCFKYYINKNIDYSTPGGDDIQIEQNQQDIIQKGPISNIDYLEDDVVSLG